jgi:UDP-glucose 4-epimerase
MAKLITGGLGFIGVYLARALLQKGEEVVLFDVVSSSPLIKDIKDKVKIVQGNLASWAEVLEVIKQNKVDGIYHTGALLSASAEEKPMPMSQCGRNHNVLKRQDYWVTGRLYEYHCLLWTRSSYGG